MGALIRSSPFEVTPEFFAVTIWEKDPRLRVHVPSADQRSDIASIVFQKRNVCAFLCPLMRLK